MSSNVFTKENLDTYLKELAKEFKRINGRTAAAEIVLVGGAAILTNYGFRNMTADIDAVIHASSAIKEAINRVSDKYDLPNGWLNADFMHTPSYSPKIDEYSVYYKTFYGILTVRSISAEYLIAMKLRSGRRYKNDLSDVIGILAEHEKRNIPISFERIEKAVTDLYGSWDTLPTDSASFIKDALATEDLQAVYSSVRIDELEAKDLLLDFKRDYPRVANDSNINDILRSLKEKRNKK